jgi:hypothetical protein
MHNFAYVLVTLCFLAGAGMQMALLSIATSLDMMDRWDWGFGQVVAITIWVPPLIAYVYREGEGEEEGNSDRACHVCKASDILLGAKNEAPRKCQSLKDAF